MMIPHPTMKDKILDLLKDGKIHGCSELLPFGLSYRNRISELKREGYEIEVTFEINPRTGRKYKTAFYKLLG